jgi:thiamine biosynthesis lipoprotein
MKLITLAALCLGLLLTGCDNDPGVKHAKFYAFGTEIDVSLYGVDADTANNTISTLESSFSTVDSTWHAWQPSVLSEINQAISQGESIAVSQAVSDLITLAQTLAVQSDHLFNPAAGKLFELWGFHQDDWFSSRPPPIQVDIDDWLDHQPSMADITIKAGILHSKNKHVKLGFGGFAKGFAVDDAIASLQQLGINNALVNIGGDLRAIGMHGKRPWVIGIRHPRQDGMIASIALQQDESVFTSGDYERFFEYQGARYSHIIDPRTGWPADQATSVTVLHHNASIADAAATALFVAGDDWPRVATAMGVSHVMLLKPNGEIELSPDMHQRINLFNNDIPPIIRTLQ